MSSDSFDIFRLWPNFSSLFDSQAFGTEAFSALIVAILFAIFIIFSTYSLVQYFRANKHIKLLSKLIDNPSGEIHHQRRLLKKQAIKKGNMGKLWLEFDGTLVEHPIDKKPCNTLNASHFFNAHSLAPGITENRLLAAVPGFLTALGVIGTFAGLQMGLTGINLSGSVNDMRTGITTVIDSASIAFLTSVWGILTSVVFNLYEKILERRIKDKIRQLQNKIDFLFPRINAEQSLIAIANSAEASQDTLNGLAEKIGDKMQEAVSGISSGIQYGIEQSMGSAVDKLVVAADQLSDKQAGGTQHALEELVAKFITHVSEAGKSQRDIMNSATSDFKATIKGWQGNMQTLADHMESQQSSSAQQEQSRIESMQTMLNQNSRLYESFENIADKLSNASSILNDFSKQVVTATSHMGQAGMSVEQAAKAMNNEIRVAVQTTTHLAEENTKVAQQEVALLEVINELNTQLSSTSDNVSKFMNLSGTIFEKMQDSQVSFQQSMEQNVTNYRTSIHQQIEEFSKKVSGFLHQYTQEVESQTSSRLGTWNKQTEDYSKSMINVVNAMQCLIDEVESKTKAVA